MAKGLAEYLGKTGKVEADGFVVDVKITDVKQAYGRTDVFVEAQNASGGKWMDAERINLDA